ncbi:serine/threonine protein kinase [Tritrichomonas foetus]|uniref:non-specific serine/threonine protein kinase n=1 Tax=Tritrichomonas foetus TaxID=1144522 RepID=A0A1J4K7Q4_9EUKA|nr:serine/threonine protein kinase [Tritrichomonas foetus]|eukprot:OHT05453.1 serine/threonine protein kinase [Tritrichomonas foetus]
MSLLVSPLANLIGDGHAVDSDEYLDFFEIDENTYPRTYLFLKAQRTILESIQQQIAKLKASKDINLDFVEYLTESLLYSIFGEVFDRAKSLIPTIRKFIDNIDHQNNQVHGMKSNQNRSNNFPSNISISEPVEVQKICQKLLSCAIALSRVFSVIACSLPTKTPDGEDITPEINYTPDINEVLVVCRICEEYVPLSLIESHSKNCAKACESEIRIMSLDDRIEKLQQSIIKIILKPIWPGNKDSCINVLLPMFHVVMLLDKALKAKTSSILDAQVLSVIMTSLHQIKIRIDNQNIESMLAKARELINEKLKVCTTKTDATYILNMIHSQNQQKVSPIIEVTIADFELIKAISSGAYARVFLGMKKKTGDIYAIKVIPKSSLSQKNQIQRILTEKDILLQNENPYIVNFCMFFNDTKRIIFIIITSFSLLNIIY